jgi:hypothetical protein
MTDRPRGGQVERDIHDLVEMHGKYVLRDRIAADSLTVGAFGAGLASAGLAVMQDGNTTWEKVACAVLAVAAPTLAKAAQHFEKRYLHHVGWQNRWQNARLELDRKDPVKLIPLVQRLRLADAGGYLALDEPSPGSHEEPRDAP